MANLKNVFENCSAGLGNLPAFTTALTANKKQSQMKPTPSTATTETLSPMAPIGVNVTKTGAQHHVGKYTPNRSASGDSVGLSFNHKADNYALGQDAWAATSQYFKGPTSSRRSPTIEISRVSGSPSTSALTA
jgi:hypothetical protein